MLKAMAKLGYIRKSDFVRRAITDEIENTLGRSESEDATRAARSLAPLFIFQFFRELWSLAASNVCLQIFLWILIGLGLFAVAYLAFYHMRFGPLIIRAEAPEERARAQRVLAGCLIGGACLVLAKPISTWLTGISIGTDPTTGRKVFFRDINGDGQCQSNEVLDLPSELADMADKLLLFLMVLGAVVLVVGIMWGGIQISRQLPKQKYP
jgi:formate hydrogenlyase subunit 3/multisubunit Na+/H+ antiporter MnhD subunit